MKIAIVENENLYTKNLQMLLEQWSKEKHTALDISCYENGTAFFSAAQSKTFDLVFMDIQMEEMDGINCAKNLRAMGFNGNIVFLTSFSEYVFEGYNVQALNYLLKPASYEKVSGCLDYTYRTLHNDLYTFPRGNEIMRIPYSKIIYFSSANHHTEIITTDEAYRQPDPLKNILPRLPECFQPCHRTAIVNLEHVSMMRGSELILSNGAILPISRTHFSSIRTTFLNYANRMQ